MSLEVPENSKPGLHVKTFGCQMNVYDSDRMTDILKREGYRWEPSLKEADVILINTCSIRAKSEQKVLSLLGELKPLKDANPKRVIGITGCVGQRMGRTLLQKVPHLDIVTGPDGVGRIGEMVKKVRDGGGRVLEAKLDPFEPAQGRTYSQPMAVVSAKICEFITVMKGCDHFCTYCIVPFVRGREKSRTIDEILSDVERLVALGTREVTFLGQNINTYGKGTDANLAKLIERASLIEGLLRIRYVTSHPRDLGQDLIEQFGTVEKLCPALHLPFQSGSTEVLKRMSRLYTREQYLEKIAGLRAACPDIALTADVIVGFPGETEEDFEQTLDVVRQVRFANIFMFMYSPRPGTKAVAYADSIPEPVKNERFQRLKQLVSKITEEENLKRIGLVEKCLIEAVDKKGLYYMGRTPHNRIVHVLNAGASCVGKVIPVEITEANGSNLKGFYVDAPRTDRYQTSRVAEALSAPL